MEEKSAEKSLTHWNHIHIRRTLI